MTRRGLIGLAGGGSALLLAAAYFFEALGWQPCAMCLWQRWPHWAAIAIAAVGYAAPMRAVAAAGGAAAATTAGLGLFHSGVERDWWDGPSSCTSSGGLEGMSGADLLSTEGGALVLCDQFTPFLFELSMANWNAILTAGLVLLWVAAVRSAPPQGR